MKEKLKTQNGIAKLTLVLVIILAIVVVGVGALTIRMLVTGEEFLAPIEELFGNEEEKDEEDKDEEEDKDVEEDKEDDEDEVVHYHGEIDFEDYTGGSSLEFSNLIEMNADIYATETEIVEIVFEFNLKEFLVEYYKAYETDLVSAGFTTYESFMKEMMTTFETSFASGFTSSSGSEVSDYFDIEHPEEEIIEMHITEDGIVDMYDSYGIEEGDSVQDIIDGFETALNIELKEV